MSVCSVLREIAVFVAWEAVDLYDWVTRRDLDAEFKAFKVAQRERLWNDASDM